MERGRVYILFELATSPMLLMFEEIAPHNSSDPSGHGNCQGMIKPKQVS